MSCRFDQLAAIEYLPQSPKSYCPNIGVIGCGGISGYHLQAYKSAGFKVTALADLDKAKAVARRNDYFPEALATMMSSRSFATIPSKWSTFDSIGRTCRADSARR